jgi:hypothetical protein
VNETSWRRPNGTTIDLVYRSQFTTLAPDLRRQAAEQFSIWVTSKGVAVSANSLLAGGTIEDSSADGTRRVVHSTVGSNRARAGGRQLHAAAFQLGEHLADGTSWTTSLRLASPVQADQIVLFQDENSEEQLFEFDPAADWPTTPWVWVDLEHHRGETGGVVRPGSPRLVRDLLAAVEGTDGSLPLTSDLLDITAGHVDELGGWLFDAARRVPVIVFTPDPKAAEEQHRFATRLARDVAGVAVVVRLPDPAAAAAFSRSVGPHLQVYGGAMRTYLPGLTSQELFPRRHRVLSAATMRALRSRSANAVRDQVLGLSTRRPAPSSYPLVRRVLARGSVERTAAEQRRRTATPQPALFPEPAGQTLFDLGAETQKQLTPEPLDNPLPRTDQTLRLRDAAAEIEMLYAEIDGLTGRLGEDQAVLDYVRTERDVVTIDLNDSERDNERLQARVRWLESELAQHQQHLTGVEPPAEFALPAIPSSVVEVLEYAAQYLPHLAIGATADAAAGLDVHPRAELWALKIWRALAALNSYAGARESGGGGNTFLAWCMEPPSGAQAVPATWVALNESETTNTMPKLREARTFAVPRAVNAAGRLYMPAHVKIQQGGTPCPRIHFYDDSGGTTGKVYVGYVGDHLPTATFR